MCLVKLNSTSTQYYIYYVWPQSFCVNCFKTRYSGSNTIINYHYVLTMNETLRIAQVTTTHSDYIFAKELWAFAIFTQDIKNTTEKAGLLTMYFLVIVNEIIKLFRLMDKNSLCVRSVVIIIKSYRTVHLNLVFIQQIAIQLPY